MLLVLTLAVVLKASAASAVCPNVSWTGGEAIKWPSSLTEQAYKTGKLFSSKNVLATRLAVHNDRAFLAMPRFKPGIPITLAKISLKTKHCEASLEPFPSWSLQEEGNCHSLQSVVDIFVDRQGIIWALDTGIVNSLDKALRKCPPKVLALHSKSGKLVKTVNLSELAKNSSRLQYLAVDNEPKSSRVFLYISDAASRAIIVYDVSSSRGYRMLLPKQVSQGCSRRDVLYLGLVHPRQESSSCLVFSYLGGRSSFAVETRQLANGFLSGGSITDLGPKKSKLVLLGTDSKSGRLFYRREAETDVYSYALTNCSRSDAEDGQMLKVYEGRKRELATHVVPDGRRRRMRVLQSSFPDYFQGYVGCGVTHVLDTF